MTVRKITPYDAKIDPTDDGGVEITFRNGTGHRMTFFVDGAPTPVYVELDGNTSHTMPSRIDKFLSIYVGNADGELLASTKWESDYGSNEGKDVNEILRTGRAHPIEIQE